MELSPVTEEEKKEIDQEFSLVSELFKSRDAEAIKKHFVEKGILKPGEGFILDPDVAEEEYIQQLDTFGFSKLRDEALSVVITYERGNYETGEEYIEKIFTVEDSEDPTETEEWVHTFNQGKDGVWAWVNFDWNAGGEVSM